jgi:hypothetical protein
MIATVKAGPDNEKGALDALNEELRGNIVSLEACVHKYLSKEYIEDRMEALRAAAKEQVQYANNVYGIAFNAQFSILKFFEIYLGINQGQEMILRQRNFLFQESVEEFMQQGDHDTGIAQQENRGGSGKSILDIGR